MVTEKLEDALEQLQVEHKNAFLAAVDAIVAADKHEWFMLLMRQFIGPHGSLVEPFKKDIERKIPSKWSFIVKASAGL